MGAIQNNARILFFDENNINKSAIYSLVNQSLYGLDDGELYLEYNESESLVYDDNKLKNANFNVIKGFGLRGVTEDIVSYAYSSDFTMESFKRAATVTESLKGYSNKNICLDEKQAKSEIVKLYSEKNPINDIDFDKKIKLLQKINNYVREKSTFVKQVSISLFSEWQLINIIKREEEEYEDIRPLIRLNITVTLEKNGRMEQGSEGMGGRYFYDQLLDKSSWKAQADEAYRRAYVNLESRPSPTGEMQVILGPGWPGVLLHEAVGHGLEGDFNRKKTSAFSDLLGKQVAAKGVTVVDNGTLANRRGSLSIDDEGTVSQRNVLIEDGILKGYMQDRLNARLMNVKPTGNGRRESYASQPMPRMTNTYMLAGDASKDDIIRSVKKGIYAVNFGGGQVDITSGKFVFSATECYMVENGEVTYPLKGVTLIGNGPDVLTKIKAIGNDLELDKGVGTCGKSGQSVPVGVGQPTLLVDSMTVGGTER